MAIKCKYNDIRYKNIVINGVYFVLNVKNVYFIEREDL